MRKSIQLGSAVQQVLSNTWVFLTSTADFTFSRASDQYGIDSGGNLVKSTTDVSAHIFGEGILLEAAATNLVWDSFNPATQTRTVTAVEHTLTIRGTGSVTLSGVGTGTATEAAPLTFTPTAGGLTMTVAGSVEVMQLETGAFGTSFIETPAGASATRADTSLTRAWPFPANEISGQIKVRPQFDGTDNKGSFLRALTIQPSADSGSDNNSLQVFFSQTASQVSLGHRDGLGAFNQIDVPVSFNAGDLLNIRFRKSSSGIKFWVNAEAPAENSGITGGFLNAPDTIAVANRRVAGPLQKAGGSYESLRIWNTALPDSTLEALT
jgi:hypothetical protein